ncbi:hypothetical protein F5883DRAFT_48465 [Diaporthe sp. PMI_573]|nr:hypothetical protein F5883DRAFT_48465 [Diaporthaceae sp. PMI_573]
MASSESISRKYFARDVVAYSDAELDQYLEECCVDGGPMVVDVEDPENLPETFIQRLRDRAGRASDTGQSRPVDPGQLTSRLLDISADRNTSPQPLSQQFDRESSVDTLPPIPPEVREREHYNTLVEEGGRPLYSIDLVDEVAKDPFSHWDMLRPWVDYPADSDPDPDTDSGVSWNVFWRQLRSWRMFRYWQKFNRDDRTGWDGPYYEVWAAYERFVWVFRRKSPTYTEAVKKLLAEYGFTRPFQFHEDPTQQDKLTTWIEYLGYECWVHYRYASRVKHMQPEYDAAWKALVDSSILRPFETEEYVCNIECAIRNQSEEDQATRAVTSARSAAKAVFISAYSDRNNPRGSRLTPAARMQMMAEAKSRLEAAGKALASAKRRGDLVTIFNQRVGKYLNTKMDAKRHSIRVQWTLEQVPLIEAELNRSSVAEAGPDTVCGTKRRFGRDEEDEATHDRIIKKQRRDAGEPGPTPGCKDSPGYQRAKPKRSHDDSADDGANNGPPSKRLKRGGGDDLGSHSETPDGADAGSAGDSRESGTAEIGRPDDDERAVMTIERPDPKGSKPSSDHLQQRKSTRNARQSSTTSQPLRRSARIAARQEALQNVVTRSGAAKSAPRISRRRMAKAPAPPSPMASQDQQSRFPATKIRKQGARGGSRRDTSKVKGTSKGRRQSSD